jgi:hypothetical protein
MLDFLENAPVWLLGLILFVTSVGMAMAGARLNHWFATKDEGWGKLTETQEGYAVTCVYTLVGLLVAFTFGIAVERFQLRRQMVLQDANAIESLYLKAQLLDEPHRSRISELVIRFGENHLELARRGHDDPVAHKLLADDDTLLRDLWTATVPAFQSIRNIDYSTSFVDAVNEVVRTDADRKEARRAAVPLTIIAFLVFYSLIAAAVLGAVMKSPKGQVIGMGLMALFVLSLMLVDDINRPVGGTIREDQDPMVRMLQRLKANPPPVYQRLVTPQGQPGR